MMENEKKYMKISSPYHHRPAQQTGLTTVSTTQFKNQKPVTSRLNFISPYIISQVPAESVKSQMQESNLHEDLSEDVLKNKLISNPGQSISNVPEGKSHNQPSTSPHSAPIIEDSKSPPSTNQLIPSVSQTLLEMTKTLDSLDTPQNEKKEKNEKPPVHSKFSELHQKFSPVNAVSKKKDHSRLKIAERKETQSLQHLQNELKLTDQDFKTMGLSPSEMKQLESIFDADGQETVPQRSMQQHPAQPIHDPPMYGVLDFGRESVLTHGPTGISPDDYDHARGVLPPTATKPVTTNPTTKQGLKTSQRVPHHVSDRDSLPPMPQSPIFVSASTPHDSHLHTEETYPKGHQVPDNGDTGTYFSDEQIDAILNKTSHFNKQSSGHSSVIEKQSTNVAYDDHLERSFPTSPPEENVHIRHTVQGTKSSPPLPRDFDLIGHTESPYSVDNSTRPNPSALSESSGVERIEIQPSPVYSTARVQNVENVKSSYSARQHNYGNQKDVYDSSQEKKISGNNASYYLTKIHLKSESTQPLSHHSPALLHQESAEFETSTPVHARQFTTHLDPPTLNTEYTLLLNAIDKAKGEGATKIYEPKKHSRFEDGLFPKAAPHPCTNCIRLKSELLVKKNEIRQLEQSLSTVEDRLRVEIDAELRVEYEREYAERRRILLDAVGTETDRRISEAQETAELELRRKLIGFTMKTSDKAEQHASNIRSTLEYQPYAKSKPLSKFSATKAKYDAKKYKRQHATHKRREMNYPRGSPHNPISRNL